VNHLSLFSGIGGIDLAAEWAGFETICFVENDKYCQKVLNKHWPDVPIIEDVKDVTKERIQGVKADTEGRNAGEQAESEGGQDIGGGSEKGITLISGGFPCQPHSVAGVRKGSDDKRNLWPEFRRIIGEIKPRWVLAENVPGLFTSDARRFFGTILSDLAEMGYAVGWATYGAVDVGALHRRNRVFIIAYRKCLGWAEGTSEGIQSSIPKPKGQELEHICEGISRSQHIPKGTMGQFPQEGLQQSGDVVDTYNSGSGLGVRGKRTGQENDEGWQGLPQPEPSQTGDVADTKNIGIQRSWPTGEQESGTHAGEGLSMCGGPEPGADQWATERRLGESTNGLPERLDCNWGDGWEEGIPRVIKGQKNRVDRLKCLGNAVVPQQIYPVLKAIADLAIRE